MTLVVKCRTPLSTIGFIDSHVQIFSRAPVTSVTSRFLVYTTCLVAFANVDFRGFFDDLVFNEHGTAKHADGVKCD